MSSDWLEWGAIYSIAIVLAILSRASDIGTTAARVRAALGLEIEERR